jgi:hypothetical protein
MYAKAILFNLLLPALSVLGQLILPQRPVSLGFSRFGESSEFSIAASGSCPMGYVTCDTSCMAMGLTVSNGLFFLFLRCLQTVQA